MLLVFLCKVATVKMPSTFQWVLIRIGKSGRTQWIRKLSTRCFRLFTLLLYLSVFPFVCLSYIGSSYSVFIYFFFSFCIFSHFVLSFFSISLFRHCFHITFIQKFGYYFLLSSLSIYLHLFFCMSVCLYVCLSNSYLCFFYLFFIRNNLSG